MIKALAILALLAGGIPLWAWLLMMTVGVVHAEWITALPTIGYPAALLVTLALFARSLGAAIIGAAITAAGE